MIYVCNWYMYATLPRAYQEMTEIYLQEYSEVQ